MKAPDARRLAGHLDSDQVAAYLERRLSADERAAAEGHLARCSRCRTELREVSPMVEAAPHRRRTIGWGLAVSAAAAAIALFVLVDRPPLEQPPGRVADDSVFRSAPWPSSERVPRIEVIAPAARARADSLRFVWRSSARDALYRLTITDLAGEIVWEGTSSDTTRVLTPDEGIVAGRDYLWYVDAILPDARVATSGIRRVHASP